MSRPSPAAGGTRDLPSLTALRWFAALIVFLRHAAEVQPPGAVPDALTFEQGATGVSFFFVLSGFILVWASKGEVDARRFYWHRIARVLPAMAVATVAIVPVLFAVGALTSSEDALIAAFTLTQLQAWIPTPAVYFGGIIVVWSLSVEAFFYAIFPFARPRLRSASTSALIILATVAASASIAFPVTLGVFFPERVSLWLIYVNPLYRSLEFLLGMALAILLLRGRLPRLPVWPTAALALLGFAAAGVGPRYAMWVAVTLVPYALLIVSLAQADLAERTPKLLATSSMQHLGRWSYAFYLVHLGVLMALADVLDADVWLQVVAAMAISLALAAALHRWVEQPVVERSRTRPPGLGRSGQPDQGAERLRK